MAARASSPEVMSEFVVFDTSVIVDQIRGNRHKDRLQTVSGGVRNSSVVLAELWRGASSTVDRKSLETLERTHPTLTPTAKNWIESGQILQEMRADKGFEPHKLRDLHFDVLIALTARTHGARLITSNRNDFELIREYREFALEVW
jgi:predicted nucleic acid-binding protein